ncbi:hypothetical protein QI155_06055 [Thermodesulfovibrio sp. 1176]|uniref:hypothetical protein n=1 Tax=Thermodesulfovibrio sp. 1176 TaxID=3043424 RepID=UPI0024825F26|nr:hypothetical protein [Thermodesulfovibrio sp. 1176]MDI1472098.1 hypothetical protein [Thermodesulfovibrio sp. 1176]
MVKPRIPIETVIFLRKAHRVVGDRRKKESKEKCRKFKNIRRRVLDENCNCSD